MKKISLVLGILWVLASCSIGKRQSADLLQSESYIQFVSDQKTTIDSDQYTIVVDGGEPIAIAIDQNTDRFQDDNKYALEVGTHRIDIYREGKLIQSVNVYIGNRETKTIKL